MRVLLVDDDEDDYLLTREHLTDISGRPYSLEWSATAAEARAVIAGNPPDVCLIDFRLGPDDGIDLTAEFIQLGYTGPIIILTGQRDEALENRALSSGAVDYLVKSRVNADQLERAIRYGLTRKQFENERFERIRAEAANRSKSDFIAYVSHELRTPLSAILSYAELVAMQAGDRQIRSYAGAIARSGQHLHGLLNDILDLSKIEAGKLDLEFDDVSIETLVGDVAATVQIGAEDKGIEFRMELPETLPRSIRTDPKRLRQMLLNLLGNAVKFTDAGVVTLRVDFDPSRPEMLLFEVSDTGIGIEKSQLEDIFKPFHQLDSGRQRGHGVGLGLAISRELVRQLGGSLDVESEPRCGSVFRLMLRTDAQAEIVRIDRSRRSAKGEGAREPAELEGHVIVVDDSDEIRDSISRVLISHGARVTTLADGRALVDVTRSVDPSDRVADLILLDMQMPGLDGYAAAREMRRLGYSGPIVALTAAAMRGARQRCLAAGCDDYLSKPVAASVLTQRIARWLKPRTLPEAALRVVVVDDVASAREPLAEVLRAQGLEVWTARNSAECRAVIDEANPNAVLLDMNLGDDRGVDLASELKREHPSMRLIAFTGSDRHAFEDAELEQFDGFLMKPVAVRDILRLLSGLASR